MAYGLTADTQKRLVERLAIKLSIEANIIEAAMRDIVKEELLRVARNDPDIPGVGIATAAC